ncbi:hypothetical protein [Nocardia asteroides]|uniref:hypothetical protein n=1 Tax=Nocardia asteroides TaxID=1824 RepID=UPI001E447E8F|nr:hypothetical protein [Nocardia asteroides]UGT59086.1 hypothetical protein LTT61_17475 [Nocardia asteroides]
MPDSEPTAASGPEQRTELPPELEALIARWNPQGMALLRAVRGTGSGSRVTLIGPDDANTTVLRTELARFEPRIALADPVPGIAASVETTSPRGAAPGPVALVLLDAGTVLGNDTVDLLRRLRADGTQVLLALNGTHAHRDWRAVRDRDEALLRAAGLELPILPVSARLAAAARGGDPALLDRSGLAALHAELCAAAAGAGGPERVAAVTTRVLTETRQRITDQVTVLRTGSDQLALRAERTALIAARDGGRTTAIATLRGQLHLARVDLLTEVGARVRALHTAARAELDKLARSDLGTYPDHLQWSVTELTGALDAAIEQRTAELATKVDGEGATVPLRRREPAPRVGPDPEPRHRGVEDNLMIALGASAGVGIGRLVVAPFSLLPALDAASVPVTLLLGAGAAAWVVRARGQVAARNHVRQWAADALVNVKAQLEQRVATALVTAETALSDHVVQATAARVVDTDRRVAELEARIRRSAAERPGQLSACERDIESLNRWIPVVK